MVWFTSAHQEQRMELVSLTEAEQWSGERNQNYYDQIYVSYCKLRADSPWDAVNLIHQISKEIQSIPGQHVRIHRG